MQKAFFKSFIVAWSCFLLYNWLVRRVNEWDGSTSTKIGRTDQKMTKMWNCTGSKIMTNDWNQLKLKPIKIKTFKSNIGQKIEASIWHDLNFLVSWHFFSFDKNIFSIFFTIRDFIRLSLLDILWKKVLSNFLQTLDMQIFLRGLFISDVGLLTWKLHVLILIRLYKNSCQLKIAALF